MKTVTADFRKTPLADDLLATALKLLDEAHRIEAMGRGQNMTGQHGRRGDSPFSPEFIWARADPLRVRAKAMAADAHAMRRAGL